MKIMVGVFLVILFAAPGPGQNSTDAYDQMNRLDSLLLSIQFDDAGEYFNQHYELLPIYGQKTILEKYRGFFTSIAMLDSQVQTINFDILQDFENSMRQSFRDEIVGPQASLAFLRFQNSLRRQNLKESYSYFLVARFFNQIFYLQEKQRLLEEFKQTEDRLKSGAFQQVLDKVEWFEKQENHQSTAFKDVGDSLNFLYSQLRSATFDSLRVTKWWKPVDVVFKKWNITALMQIGLVHRYNKEIFHVYYSTSEHDAYLMGQVVDPLSFTFSVQPAYYISSKLLVGFKPFYGIAFNKRVNIGDQVTQEYQVNSNSFFLGTSIFTRYYLRDKVGARPYLDMGFGMIWTCREETELTEIYVGSYTETAVIKETRWNDPFLDIEAGIDYSPTIESRYIYSISVQFKLLLDEGYKIYSAHYGMGFKIGLLLN